MKVFKAFLLEMRNNVHIEYVPMNSKKKRSSLKIHKKLLILNNGYNHYRII